MVNISEKEKFSNIVNKLNWKKTKSFGKYNHYYVLLEDFDNFEDYIFCIYFIQKNYTLIEKFFGKDYKYLIFDNNKYWICKTFDGRSFVINKVKIKK
ncbi:MAG: hypothetical protein QXN68_00775 [Thermoplasmata archaeon]